MTNLSRAAGIVLLSVGPMASAGHMSAGRPAAAAHVPTWGKAMAVPGVADLGKDGSIVVSVSCGSPGNCGAGGYYFVSQEHEQPFVVTEKNGVWAKAVEVPGIAALNKGRFGQVLSVSCASAGNCSAGGFYDSGSSRLQAFVVIEKQGRWGKAIEVPGSSSLNRTGDAAISAISCTSAGNCGAGGFYADKPPGITTRPTEAFVVTEKGSVWGKAMEVPGTASLNGGSGNQVTTVSCASAGNCTAAGGPTVTTGRGPSPGQAFVANEKKGTWRKAFVIPGSAALNKLDFAGTDSISCPSAGNCSVAGYYSPRTGLGAFLDSEKNGIWGKAFGVRGIPSGFDQVQINSLSCASVGNCVASGGYTNDNGNGQAFVVSQTDDTWSKAIIVPGTVALNKDDMAQVTTVSCPAPGSCAAAGDYIDGASNGQAFVVTESNGAWHTAIEVPGIANLKRGSASINSVSCASAGKCSAGGVYSYFRVPGSFEAMIVSRS